MPVVQGETKSWKNTCHCGGKTMDSKQIELDALREIIKNQNKRIYELEIESNLLRSKINSSKMIEESTTEETLTNWSKL